MTVEKAPSTDKLTNCEICGGKMDDLIVMLPIRQLDGSYETLACLNCAEQSGVYCLIHGRPHIGFEDETTACLVCIEEKVRDEGSKVIVEFFQRIKDSTQKEDIFKGLESWSNFLSTEMGLSDQSENVARAIITAAFRFNKSSQEIIDQVSKEGLDLIIPPSVMESVDYLRDLADSS